jgi:integrase
MYAEMSMARMSYLMRREGRYYVQARLSPHVAAVIGRPLYRASLRTADYRQARARLLECMTWVLRMNDSIDHVSLLEKNAIQLRHYLEDDWPISEERFIARRNYEELLKNMVRRARADGCDPTMIEPDFQTLLNHFVRQNVDVEDWLRKVEHQRHYERGRADAEARLGDASTPASFRLPLSAGRMLSRTTPNHPAFSNSSVPPAEPAARVNALSDLEVSLMRGPVKREMEGSESRSALRLSVVLSAYVEQDIERGGNADARSVLTLIVQFIIDMMDDPVMERIGAVMVRQLDEMLPDIPDRQNIPREHCRSLATRYRYAQNTGWDGLKRLTEARLQNGYHDALARFFDWAIAGQYYPYPKPGFSKTSPENLVSIQRDSFKPAEVRTIFSQPLFTGCHSADRIWVPGTSFLQNHLYWGYVLSFLTGLRAGELGEIALDDIEEGDDGICYLQLRGFNPAKGRVARKHVRRFKTQSSHRTIPLHPLILDLGLFERIADLRKIGCPVLFPEWDPYPKPGGEMRWGQPLTKSFQYLKKKVGIQRFDVTLYSSRHWFADLLDNTDVKHAARTRVMGHRSRSDTPARYGAKQRLTTRDLAQIVGVSLPVIDEMTELLMGAKSLADAGELQILKPWLLAHNWSAYYKAKLLDNFGGRISRDEPAGGL